MKSARKNGSKLQDGWPKLREFLGLPVENNDKFPHENKGAVAAEFITDLFTGTDYDEQVSKEVIAYFNRNGFDCKKI